MAKGQARAAQSASASAVASAAAALAAAASARRVQHSSHRLHPAQAERAAVLCIRQAVRPQTVVAEAMPAGFCCIGRQYLS